MEYQFIFNQQHSEWSDLPYTCLSGFGLLGVLGVFALALGEDVVAADGGGGNDAEEHDPVHVLRRETTLVLSLTVDVACKC